MSVDLIKYAFVAGELSPTFYGRTDLTKYDLAMAEAYNFFVDYRGGLSNRPGFEFVNYLPDYDEGDRTLELIDPPRFFNFTYDPDPDFSFLGIIAPLDGTYSIIRFLQNGAYVTEPAFTVSGITQADPAVVTTSAAHGLTSGDWVTFNYGRDYNPDWRGRTVIVTVLSSTTFSVASTTTLDDIDSTAFDSDVTDLTIARILTLQCTYRPNQYAMMDIKQYKDLIRICHPAHPIRNLIRSNDTTLGTVDANGNVWYLEDEVIGTNSVGPTINGFTVSSTGEAQTIFAVTSVFPDGSESIRGPLFLADGLVNYPATEGSVSITWDIDPLAAYYNVYRSIVSVTETLTSGVEVGFIGQTRGTKFTDPNIIPDFTRVPPQRKNPFAQQPIAEVKVVDGGSGYTDFTTAAYALGTGTGFYGNVVVDENGAVVNVEIVDGGTGYAVGKDQTGIITLGAVGESGGTPFITVYRDANYSGDSASFSGAVANIGDFLNDSISSFKATGSWTFYVDQNYGGSSTTLSGNHANPWPSGTFHDTITSFKPSGSVATSSGILATVNDTIGTYPAVSCVYQQRQLYAASYDKPTTIWGSQIKLFSNFDVTANLVDSDSFEFSLDTPSFANIRHMIPMQAGLIVTTQESLWVLSGGGPLDPITPTNAAAIPQTYNGAGQLHPLKIGSELLYTEGKGSAVRMLSYNEISRVYSGDDRSILSNHLFGLGREITSWAYQESPFKIVWCAQRSGDLLAFTVVKNEDIYAWTPCGTNGQFLSVANLRENNAHSDDMQIINDRVYVVTQRYLQGRWRRMIERMGLRNFTNVEDGFFVDAGWSLPANYVQGNLNVYKTGDTWYAKTDTGDLTGLAALITANADKIVFGGA